MKVPLCSTGHRPLRGRCPATHHIQSPTYEAGQRVSLTTYCPWATGCKFRGFVFYLIRMIKVGYHGQVCIAYNWALLGFQPSVMVSGLEYLKDLTNAVKLERSPKMMGLVSGGCNTPFFALASQITDLILSQGVTIHFLVTASKETHLALA